MIYIIILIVALKYLAEREIRYSQKVRFEADSLTAQLRLDSVSSACSMMEEGLLTVESSKPALTCECNADGAGKIVFAKNYETWSDDSVNHFIKRNPFQIANYRKKFHQAKMKIFDLSAVEIDTSKLEALSLKDYYTIFQEQASQDESTVGTYYFYSLQDTAKYYSMTILHYLDDHEIDLYLVNINQEGIKQADTRVAGFSYYSPLSDSEGFHRNFNSRFINPHQLIGEEILYAPNMDFDENKKPSKRNYIANEDTYTFTTIVGPRGEMIQMNYQEKRELITHRQ